MKSDPGKGKMSETAPQQILAKATQVQDANARSLAASHHLVDNMIEMGTSAAAALKLQTGQMAAANEGLTAIDSDLHAADRQIRAFAPPWRPTGAL